MSSPKSWKLLFMMVHPTSVDARSWIFFRFPVWSCQVLNFRFAVRVYEINGCLSKLLLDFGQISEVTWSDLQSAIEFRNAYLRFIWQQDGHVRCIKMANDAPTIPTIIIHYINVYTIWSLLKNCIHHCWSKIIYLKVFFVIKQITQQSTPHQRHHLWFANAISPESPT